MIIIYARRPACHGCFWNRPAAPLITTKMLSNLYDHGDYASWWIVPGTMGDADE